MQQEELKQKWSAFKLKWLGSEDDIEKKQKREFVFELALFLVLGILLGITIKTEAVKRITIGFNDYKIGNGKNGYDIDAIRKNLEDQTQTEQTTQQVQAQQ